MRRFKNLLAGVDLSQADRFVSSKLRPPSIETVEHALWLTKRNSAGLTCLHPLDVSPATVRMIIESAGGKDTLLDQPAVEEERGESDNLTKFMVWIQPAILGEMAMLLAAILTGVMLTLLPVQILWITMTTAVLLGLMLAFESKEPDTIRRSPRHGKIPLLDGKLILQICIVGVTMLIRARNLCIVRMGVRPRL